MPLFGSQNRPAQGAEEQAREAGREEDRDRNCTRIADGISFSGEISGKGVVRIEGVLEGKISVEGTAIVAEGGRAKGPIEADTAVVAGTVEGNVSCRGHLRLERTGSICGDVSAASFVVEDGGRVNGRVSMPRGGSDRTADPAGEDPDAMDPFGGAYAGADPDAGESGKMEV